MDNDAPSDDAPDVSRIQGQRGPLERARERPISIRREIVHQIARVVVMTVVATTTMTKKKTIAIASMWILEGIEVSAQGGASLTQIAVLVDMDCMGRERLESLELKMDLDLLFRRSLNEPHRSVMLQDTDRVHDVN